MTAENQSHDRNIGIKGNADGSTLIIGDGNTITTGAETSHLPLTGGLSSQLSPPYFFPEAFEGSVFVGRDREIKSLHALLQQADRVAIAAVGMGGIGKTALARSYVKQHQTDYPGGIWWLPVAQLVTTALAYAGRSTGLDELPSDWPNERIVQHYLSRWEALFPGRKLLVLDDVGGYKPVKT